MSAGWLLALALFAAAEPRDAGFQRLAQAAAKARDAGRADDAIRLYREALALQPSWQEGLWYLGTLLYERESFAEARDTLRWFVARKPDAGPGWALLGMSEFQTREYAGALRDLQHGLKDGLGGRTQLTRSTYFFVSALLTRFGRFDESIDLFLRQAALEHSLSTYFDAAGLAALRMPLLPAEIPPGRRDMVRLAGQAVYAIACRRNQEAETLLKRLVSVYPDKPGVHFFYGAFLMDSAPERGVAEMQRELEVAPNSVVARIRLAAEYVRENKLDAALPLARQAATLGPQSPVAHATLGKILLDKHDLPGAIRELETARKQDPTVLRTHWLLSRAYREAGRVADSKREVAEVQRLEKLEKQHAGSL